MNENLKIFLKSLALFTGIVLISHLDDFFIKYFNLVQFDLDSAGTLRADISHLPPGKYYFSLGRTRGRHAIYLDEKLIGQNGPTYDDSYDGVSLGASFIQEEGKESKTIEVRSLSEFNVFSTYTHIPTVLNVLPGKLLHYYRMLTYSILPSLISISMLIFWVFFYLIRKYEVTFFNKNIPFFKELVLVIFTYACASLNHSLHLQLIFPRYIAFFIHSNAIYLNAFFFFNYLIPFIDNRFRKYHFLIIIFLVCFDIFYIKHVNSYEMGKYTIPSYFFGMITSVFISIIFLLNFKREDSEVFSIKMSIILFALTKLLAMIIIVFPLNKYGLTFCYYNFSVLVICLLLSTYTYRKMKANDILYIQKFVHDIRSPISVIKKILNQSSDFTKNKKSIMDQSIIRIESIVKKVLIKEVQKKEKINLCHLLKCVVREKKEEFDNKVWISFQAKNDFFAFCDSSNLVRVISNLINNAYEANPCNCRIEISLRLLESKNFSILEVSDNGPGISPEIIRKVKSGEKFTTKEFGNGIGLISSIELIEKMGGKMKIFPKTARNGFIQIQFPMNNYN